ncbi:2,4-dichlorophenol 6-monooxygenase [Mycobacterium attenuatum]|uniref:2,4-dichlorophenol 6-monooxygenase n=2 Tax=Mycobacterium attenuatum TaxID=2341086 RepID=A0A498Q6K5_9MYCO|nr:2,4-dichlorophenol 6-monooxygenase [Mycobacterium attenuatum]
MFQLLIGYRYHSAAVVTGQPAVDPDEVHLVDELCGQPGTRVPHLWIWQGGQRVSTLDLLGPGFSLLTGDERWREAAAAVSHALGVPIATQCLGDEAWFAATRLAPGGALLVRPDDFVGLRCGEFPADPTGVLRQALSRILCR